MQNNDETRPYLDNLDNDLEMAPLKEKQRVVVVENAEEEALLRKRRSTKARTTDTRQKLKSAPIPAIQPEKGVDFEKDYRVQREVLVKRIENLKGQLMVSNALSQSAISYFNELRTVSINGLFVIILMVLLAIPNLYGYIITLSAIIGIFFFANLLVVLFPWGNALHFIEIPNLFLVILTTSTTLYRWIFNLQLDSVCSWGVNLILTVLAIFSLVVLISGVNLEHNRLHVRAMIMEREAWRNNKI